MIKAVLFDFGGVLSEQGKAGSIAGVVAELFGRKLADMQFQDLHMQFFSGALTMAEYLAKVGERYPTPRPITEQMFVERVRILTHSQPVYALAERVRAHGIATGILSNMYAIGAAQLRAASSYDGFDPVVLSCEAGLAKPQTAFYQLALDKLGLPGSEVVFIDDQAQYGPPAQALGMRFILAESPQQIVHDVTALIQQENDIAV